MQLEPNTETLPSIYHFSLLLHSLLKCFPKSHGSQFGGLVWEHWLLPVPGRGMMVVIEVSSSSLEGGRHQCWEHNPSSPWVHLSLFLRIFSAKSTYMLLFSPTSSSLFNILFSLLSLKLYLPDEAEACVPWRSLFNCCDLCLKPGSSGAILSQHPETPHFTVPLHIVQSTQNKYLLLP